ncbi:hypothetical protein GE061_013298 [Apolygus lucorum]|uniref:Retrotransposon gag domain-containing protein n=1 Tax=Apolygus lucorum TaxID=248454 RepID=A0A8S9XRG7_APOLU|nr:hypothetical protein GE061_013298 [Apolygus lucorum]
MVDHFGAFMGVTNRSKSRGTSPQSHGLNGPSTPPPPGYPPMPDQGDNDLPLHPPSPLSPRSNFHQGIDLDGACSTPRPHRVDPLVFAGLSGTPLEGGSVDYRASGQPNQPMAAEGNAGVVEGVLTVVRDMQSRLGAVLQLVATVQSGQGALHQEVQALREEFRIGQGSLLREIATLRNEVQSNHRATTDTLNFLGDALAGVSSRVQDLQVEVREMRDLIGDDQQAHAESNVVGIESTNPFLDAPRPVVTPPNHRGPPPLVPGVQEGGRGHSTPAVRDRRVTFEDGINRPGYISINTTAPVTHQSQVHALGPANIAAPYEAATQNMTHQTDYHRQTMFCTPGDSLIRDSTGAPKGVDYLLKLASQLVPTYTGDKGSDIDDFLTRLQHLRSCCEAPDHLWVFVAKARLAGPARALIYKELLPAQTATLEALEIELRRRFEGIHTSAYYLELATQARLNQGEAVEAFGSRIRELLTKAWGANHPFIEVHGKDYFAKGLPKEQARFIFQARPLTLAEAIAKAVDYREVEFLLGTGEKVTSCPPKAPIVHTLTITADGRDPQQGQTSTQPQNLPRTPTPPPVETGKQKTGQNGNWRRPSRMYCPFCNVNQHWPSQCDYRHDGPKAGQAPIRQDGQGRPASKSTRSPTNSGAPNGKGGQNPPQA